MLGITEIDYIQSLGTNVGIPHFKSPMNNVVMIFGLSVVDLSLGDNNALEWLDSEVKNEILKSVRFSIKSLYSSVV